MAVLFSSQLFLNERIIIAAFNHRLSRDFGVLFLFRLIHNFYFLNRKIEKQSAPAERAHFRPLPGNRRSVACRFAPVIVRKMRVLLAAEFEACDGYFSVAGLSSKS